MNPLEFPTLQSVRLNIRQHLKSDIESYFNIMSDIDVVRYYGKRALDNLSEAEEDFKLYNEKFVQGDMIKWALELKESKEYVGSIGAFGFASPHHRATISCVLGKQYWHNGIATEALLTVMRFLFSDININRIQLYVDPVNRRAVKLFQALGFHKEGLLREYEFEYGKAIDLLIMSKLKKEWKRKESY